MAAHNYIILSIVVIAMYLMIKNIQKKQWQYRCPQCGATRPDDHKEGCSFKERF